MIRYDVSIEELERRINAIDDRWLAKASARTKALRAAQRFNENTSIWSEIKEVFIEIQFRKCIFCERQLEGPEIGKIEYDVEHFRPKSSVKAWPAAGIHSVTYPFATGKASEVGYYWLAYELGNYAASCKNCNTPLKSNYFPIAGKRARKLASRSALRAERPFLCYPIGRDDDDPEDLVTFRATTAVPASGQGERMRRGQVIIDFFELNEREQLHRERAQMILLLGTFLEKRSQGAADNEDLAAIETCVAPNTGHSSCLRAFKKLWESDSSIAEKVYQECKRYFARGDRIPAI